MSAVTECVCVLPVAGLTQSAKELNSQRSVDEEEEHEEKAQVSHLQVQRHTEIRHTKQATE